MRGDEGHSNLRPQIKLTGEALLDYGLVEGLNASRTLRGLAPTAVRVERVVDGAALPEELGVGGRQE
jgi:hypothetical protein